MFTLVLGTTEINSSCQMVDRYPLPRSFIQAIFQSIIQWWRVFCSFVWGHLRPFFLYFRLFYKQLTVNKCSIKVADDWIRTRVLWDCKQPLCQLRHNHFPIIHFFLYVCSQADLVIARVFLHLSLGDTNISISIHCWPGNQSTKMSFSNELVRITKRHSPNKIK